MSSSWTRCKRCGTEYNEDSGIAHECPDREADRRLEELEKQVADLESVVDRLCARLGVSRYES